MSTENLSAIGTPTPYAVVCDCTGERARHYLTKENYKEQMMRPNSRWRCPTCGMEALGWDDDNWEKWCWQAEPNPAP